MLYILKVNLTEQQLNCSAYSSICDCGVLLQILLHSFKDILEIHINLVDQILTAALNGYRLLYLGPSKIYPIKLVQVILTLLFEATDITIKFLKREGAFEDIIQKLPSVYLARPGLTDYDQKLVTASFITIVQCRHLS